MRRTSFSYRICYKCTYFRMMNSKIHFFFEYLCHLKLLKRRNTPKLIINVAVLDFFLGMLYVVFIFGFCFLNNILHQEYNTDLLRMLTFKNIINVMFVIKYSMLVLKRSVFVRDSIFCDVNGEISVRVFDPVQHSADPDRGHL